jgi:hypothetical protein
MLRPFLRLEPEELALRLFACIRQRFKPHEIFSPASFADEFWYHGNDVYPRLHRRAIVLAMQGALDWLVQEGLIMRDPEQSGSFYILTRRGQTLNNAANIADFKVARSLPRDALHPSIADKVWAAFLRGEYDVAVFQAMKAVEVAVRDASGLGNSSIGVALMRAAFHPDRGPLSDLQSEAGERRLQRSLREQ